MSSVARGYAACDVGAIGDMVETDRARESVIERDDGIPLCLWVSRRQGHILSDFRALLKWCEITGRVGRSPFVSRLVMPRIPEQAPKGLSPAEVTALTSLPGEYGWTWRFLIGTGLRWGEATPSEGGPRPGRSAARGEGEGEARASGAPRG